MLRRTSLIATFALAFTTATHAGAGYVRPLVPETIEPPAGLKLVLVGHAVGTQNYICAPASTPTGVDWLFVGPQATLFDDYGRQITTHYQSKNPLKNDALHATWQHSGDTSAVWATRLRGSTDAAYVAPDAIEWLLLEMSGAVVGPFGGDKLAHVKYLQRVNTAGGLKPSTGCTASTVNTRKMVNYTADYYFYE
jgi:Protein of unknown function (DUF3455)